MEYTQKELNDMPYKDYLKTEIWQSIRKLALFKADYECHVFGNCDGKKLEVHHRNYPDNRGQEDIKKDLHILCKEHHRILHCPKTNDENCWDFGLSSCMLRPIKKMKCETCN